MKEVIRQIADVYKRAGTPLLSEKLIAHRFYKNYDNLKKYAENVDKTQSFSKEKIFGHKIMKNLLQNS